MGVTVLLLLEHQVEMGMFLLLLHRAKTVALL